MKSSQNDFQLLSLIAHELRSPAAVSAGYLRLLLRDDVAHLPERARHMIEEADRSCARILHLVREVSDLAALSSRGASDSCSVVPVFSLCDEVIQQLAEAAGGGTTTFSCGSEDQPALVHGDVDQLKRALAALVVAIVRERGAAPLEIHGFINREGEASLAVIALGDPGIALRHDEVLTSREVPFDRWRGGTGLSVPIACRLFEACGGRIWSLPQSSRAACALSLPMA
ncbi:MAG: HAMP domain-containing sensor histidine kinase [Acidobacteriota bacterium]